MRTEIGPIRLLKSSPRHCQEPPNIQKCFFSHRGPYMKSWSFSLLYLSLHCDEVFIRWHFGTLDSANGHPGPPRHEQKSYFGFLTCRLIWIHYDYWRAPRSHKYKYIYIFFTMWSIYMKYQLFILSFLYMCLPCDEMFLHKKKIMVINLFLNIPGALKHNIKNVEVFR